MYSQTGHSGWSDNPRLCCPGCSGGQWREHAALFIQRGGDRGRVQLVPGAGQLPGSRRQLEVLGSPRSSQIRRRKVQWALLGMPQVYRIFNQSINQSFCLNSNRLCLAKLDFSVLDPDLVGPVSFGRIRIHFRKRWIRIRVAKKIVINSNKNQPKLKECIF